MISEGREQSFDEETLPGLLMACRAEGLTLADDLSKIADRIVRSPWIKAVQSNARRFDA
ncbi:MAG: hypothetical protein ACXV2H_07180 [Actinomycetes bacterium]